MLPGVICFFASLSLGSCCQAACFKAWAELQAASLPFKGKELQDRLQDPQFAKADTALLAAGKRVGSLRAHLRDREGKEIHEEIAQCLPALDSSVAAAEKMLAEHGSHFQKAADAKIREALAVLEPMAGGLPEGKTWKGACEAEAGPRIQNPEVTKREAP